ncbi:MAG: hypothetical protein GKS03_11375 [Alphaproteobacteria bacterium]|nr:hypothetical protein [Alphaproteobacteria bacterium]
MHRRAISIITDLEKSIDTSAITYGGVHAWPLCRLKLWVHFMAESFASMAGTDAPEVSNDGPSFQDVGKLDAHVVGNSGLPLIHSDQNASREAMRTSTETPDLLFFLRPEEHREAIGDQAYAKILDSLFDRFPQHGRVKIEWAEPTAMGFARKNPSLFLHASLASNIAEADPPYSVENFENLNKALSDLSLNAVVTEDTINEGMEKIFWFSRLFETVLVRLQPKVIFLSVYYHPLGMGLVLAARRLGIPTIDVQHGRLGPLHGLYTQMTAAPPKGYETVPDKIWCWGNQTKQDIDVDLNPDCSKHGAIVGGNPWFDLWKGGGGTLPDESAAQALLDRNTGKKVIIVSLQSLPHPLPVFVLDAMARAPEDWAWWIRMHPLRRHTIKEVDAHLKKLGVQNFEIEDTTSMPLFWLLRHSDHHITSFSSVAIEALAFGLRTTLFSKAGRDAFLDYVNDGHAVLAEDADSLLHSIAEALDMPPPEEKKPFIDSTPGLAEKALTKLYNI